MTLNGKVRSFTTLLLEPRLIEQRYEPFARFSPTLYQQAYMERQRYLRKGPCALLMIIPPEIPVDANGMNEDYLREEGLSRQLLAVAVVAESAAMNAAYKFYFRYYSRSFEARVFTSVTDALQWLKQHLAMAPASGK